MTTSSMRQLSVVAGLAWLVVAGTNLRSAVVDDGDDWELAYTLFSIALVAGAALIVTIAAWATARRSHPRLRTVGLVVSGVGVAASIVAWAFPLWMTVLGLGLAMVGVAVESGERRPIALLSAAHLAGLVVAIAATAAEVGRRDEWGDYPVAVALGVVATAAITVAALWDFNRRLDRRLDPVA